MGIFIKVVLKTGMLLFMSKVKIFFGGARHPIICGILF